MSTIFLDEIQLDHYKRELARLLPAIKPSHRMEVMAAGFHAVTMPAGVTFAKYASLRSAIAEAGPEGAHVRFNLQGFRRRAVELGYEDIGSIEVLAELFSYRSFVQRVNEFGQQAIDDLVRVARLSNAHAAVIAEMFLGRPISTEGAVNLVPLSEIEAVIRVSAATAARGGRGAAKPSALLGGDGFASGKGELLLANTAAAIDLNAPADYSYLFKPPLLGIKGGAPEESVDSIGKFWGLASHIMRWQLRDVSESAPVLSALHVDCKAGMVAFFVEPTVLRFLRMRQLAHDEAGMESLPSDKGQRADGGSRGSVHRVGTLRDGVAGGSAAQEAGEAGVDSAVSDRQPSRPLLH
jgi:hypothetical protein